LKNKILKSFICFALILQFLIIGCETVHAATFSVKASTSSVDPGDIFTVTISASGAGKFSVNVNNGSGGGELWVEGSESIKITAGKSGTTSVTVTAKDATTYGEEPITGSKTVSVKINSSSTEIPTPKPPSPPDNETNNETTTHNPKPVDTKSNIDTLASLTVSTGELSPKFTEATTSYKVDLTSDITNVTIDAKAKDTKAKVSGVGKKDLVIGSQTYTVTVVAENGAKKVYSITFNVKEKPTVFTTINGTNEKLGILKDVSKVEVPKNFKSTTVKLENQEITGWMNEKGTLTLVYLENEKGERGFYLYENNKIIGQYKTIEVLGKTYVILPRTNVDVKDYGVKESLIKIGETELEGWVFENKDYTQYSLVYLMNENGEKALYSYEHTDGTLQKYKANKANIIETSHNTPLYVFIGTTILFAFTTLFVTLRFQKFKKKSIAVVKDFYESKGHV